MSCCGQRRERLSGNPPSRPANEPAAEGVPRQRAIYFEYTGNMALTVFGPVSGRRYRFAGQGARLAIDPRDRPSLAAVPRLREVTVFGEPPA